VVEQPKYDFSPGELDALTELRATLRQVEEWPPDSPAIFVLRLASRTRGVLGEKLLIRFATHAGLTARKSGSAAYDVDIGELRCEVKFSTEDPPRFQQVRHPKPWDALKYDYLVCISLRPDNLVYWLIPAPVVVTLIEQGHIPVQHADSTTRWFRPSRTTGDVFSDYRSSYTGLLEAFKAFQ
jgi:hypothetical protein